MQTYQFALQPLSAFGTPLAGDTLFGQLCWTLRHQLGNERLNTLLEGYTSGQPFAVVSDAMPQGHLPLPSVPSSFWAAAPDADRKVMKKKRWLPHTALTTPFATWQEKAVNDAAVAKQTERAQPHNTINRDSGTTGVGQFAPYAMSQIWFQPGVQFDVHVVLDETRLSVAEFTTALDAMGSTGFGRDASIGLGKYKRIGEVIAVHWPAQPGANAYLTLGPSAPQGQGFCASRSFYQVVTRFGRHGDATVQSGNPFKKPVLLARAGSVLWPEQGAAVARFVGQGLGGVAHPISQAMPETVHQGYAPAVAIRLPEGATP